MSETDLKHFSNLKAAVQQQVAQRLGINKNLETWSLTDIRDFQADLESICKSTLSEKWVYLHFKSENKKLPRIDVRNLLSQYCGHKNWDDFVQSMPDETKEVDKTKPIETKNRWWVWALGAMLVVALLVIFIPKKSSKTVLFYDAYTLTAIEPRQLTLKLKRNGKQLINKNIMHSTADTLEIDGAYYKPKKVFLGGTEDTLKVALFPDDYALMLNFFSRSTADDWQKRRAQLLAAIHPEAKIFQSHPQYDGIELLNRDEFIDRLILPINSLKNLEIQDIVYKDEKIYRLRFVQKID